MPAPPPPSVVPDNVEPLTAADPATPEPVAPVVAARRLEEAKADLLERAVATAPGSAHPGDLAPLVARGFDVHAVARRARPSALSDGSITWHQADLGS